MVLEDKAKCDKRGRLNRIEWIPESKNRVRQKWSTRADEGSTWIAVFDGLYERNNESIGKQP